MAYGEKRKAEAVELVSGGESISEVARQLHVAKLTVMRWCKEAGVESMHHGGRKKQAAESAMDDGYAWRATTTSAVINGWRVEVSEDRIGGFGLPSSAGPSSWVLYLDQQLQTTAQLLAAKVANALPHGGHGRGES
jgi:hypothetical protein